MKNTTINKVTMEVQICGPNLNHPSTGCAFRVHAATCSHAKRDMCPPLNWDENGWKMQASSLQEIAACIYKDMINEGSMTEDDALEDVDFCACVKLPI